MGYKEFINKQRRKKMTKKYEIKDLDFNEINFIEQSLKARVEYYEDRVTKKPDEELYSKSLKTVKDLYLKVKQIRNLQGEKISYYVKSK